MLALTHHVVVQTAAITVGVQPFTHYAVLGDDIVICNDKVAQEYLRILDILGVKVNKSKSVISTGMLEFAKR